MKFDEFKIHAELLEAISYMNYEKASPIQELAIPAALDGHDVLACAQTGTGKTASFVIPILNDIVVKNLQTTTSLILVPTRELAIQIHQEIQGFSYFTDCSCKAVYGGDKGSDWDAQKQSLTEGTQIIIATPGRLLAHLQLGYVSFSNIQHFVLDEADRMLDMGFIDDIKRILTYLPKQKQTLFFSATMPPAIKKLAHEILKEPKEIKIAISKPAEGVSQKAYLVYPNQKIKTIQHILSLNPSYDSIIIFTSTKRLVSRIVEDLRKYNPQLSVQGMSSDFEQKEREEVLLQFKAKQTKVLVATDVMSRGIDIKGINVVINYDVPHDAVDYVHRVGRTARADAKGEAITLISDADIYKFHRIEQLIEKQVPKLELPKEFGKTPTWELAKKPKRTSTPHKSNTAKQNSNKRKPWRKKSSANGRSATKKPQDNNTANHKE